MLVQRLSNQQIIILENKLGSGGEGNIYRVPGDPGLVAKIYHKPTTEAANKLRVMLENPPDEPAAAPGHISIAWPIDLLRPAYGHGEIIGFLMRKVTQVHPIHNFYTPRTRRQKTPLFNYFYLHRTARNLAAAVAALHARGYVIGDINESNILVSSRALVTLVDTDSFQVRHPQYNIIYRCPVGKREFTPPELQGQWFRDRDRTPEHDRFGMAVLIFQLLMEGTHPFEGVYLGSEDPPPTKESRIKAGHFPYGHQSIPYRPKPLSPAFEILHPTLRQLFIQCFEGGHTDPTTRPDAPTWVKALETAEKNLVICAVNPQHRYGEHLNRCPWCDRQVLLKGRDPFPAQPTLKLTAVRSPTKKTLTQPATKTAKVYPAKAVIQHKRSHLKPVKTLPAGKLPVSQPLTRRQFLILASCTLTGVLGAITVQRIGEIRSRFAYPLWMISRVFGFKTFVIFPGQSIAETLKNAPSGSRIIVRPGLYKESLILDHPVEIIGDGAANTIIIESTNATCIQMQTRYAKLQNLTLRAQNSFERKKFFAVEISQGQFVLDSCDITSKLGGCISVASRNAIALLRHCTIHDALETGILFRDRAQGLVEDCQIFKTGFAGIEIRENSDPLIRRCQVRDNQGNGIYIDSYAKGMIENCDVFNNSLAGIEINHYSQPTIRHCQISRSKQGGIFLQKNSQGLIENCAIFANALAGIEIKLAANPLIRGCKIYQRNTNGILVQDEGKGMIENCDIFENSLANLEIRENSNPGVRDCQIHHGKEGGVLVDQNGLGTLENCRIFANAFAGIEIRRGGNPVIENCIITQNNASGLYVHTQGKGQIKNSDLTGNKLGAFKIDSKSSLRQEGNQIK